METEEELGIDIPDTNGQGDPPEVMSITSLGSSEKALVMLIAIFILRLQSKHYIPEAAIECLLKFLYSLFVIIGRFSDIGRSIAQHMPKSVHCLRKVAGITDHFEKLVVCFKCNSVYKMDDCIERRGVSKVCEFREFPCSKKCLFSLLREVELASKKKILYPFKTYCYQNIKTSLQRLYNQPNFHNLCEEWRSRKIKNGNMGDIYDGKIWKEFQNVSGRPFLSSKFNLAFCLNVDWFQPYSHTQSSVGVMYLTILNLPRHLRNKHQYTLLVGVIPGPDEPKRDINSYLNPMVKELLSLWDGEHFQVHSFSDKQLVRGALICIACDLPAARKVAGFLSHSAAYGCSKCMKKFPGGFGSKDYSGFERNTWPARSNITHRAAIEIINNKPNKTQRNQAESEYGCRYSALLKLGYFDPVRMVVVDPMHNLFLGSAKHVMKVIWANHNIISPAMLLQMQEVTNSFHVPTDCGRIPRKLETNFSGFTAAQFKNWVTLYSIPCLYGKVEERHLECWRSFVIACRLLCKHTLEMNDIQLADALLQNFCKKVELLYGRSAVTPNMHMHGHLKEVIEDFGPLHAFWLFSYERFNGILGKYPNNNKSIEVQIMSKFAQESDSLLMLPPTDFVDDLDMSSLFDHLQLPDSAPNPQLQLPPKCTTGVFSQLEIKFVQKVLSKINSVSDYSTVDVNSCFRKYSSASILGVNYVSTSKKSSHKNIAIAEWKSSVFGPPCSTLPGPYSPNEHKRPIKILYFAEVAYNINNTPAKQVFAVSSWFAPHPERYLLGRPAQIWCKGLFEVDGTHSFVPCDFLVSQCAHCIKTIEEIHESVLIVVSVVA